MIYQRGHLARPLDAVLGSATKVAVLRVLFAEKNAMSGRNIAERAGVNHQAAALALKALEVAGIVQKREYPRSIQWQVDLRREMVAEVLRPLFEGEGRNAQEIAGEIKGRLQHDAESVLICGKAAAGKLAPGQPLEIAVICEHGKRRHLQEALRGLESALDSSYGLGLKVHVLTRKEAQVRVELLDGWQLLPTEGPPHLFSTDQRK